MIIIVNQQKSTLINVNTSMIKQWPIIMVSPFERAYHKADPN